MKREETTLALRVIHSADWFQGFSAELAQELVGNARLIRLNAGEWAHGEGDEKRGLFIVIEGTFHTYCAVTGDRHVMVGQAEAGSVIGHATRFGGGPRLVTAVCATQALMLEISEVTLERIAERKPEVWRMIASSAYISLRRAVRTQAEMIVLPSRQRLARRLLACADFSDRAHPTVNLSQKLLAEMSGITRKTANLHLVEFKNLGIIEIMYGSIRIIDVKQMELISHEN